MIQAAELFPCAVGQGYDAAQMLGVGLTAAKGDVTADRFDRILKHLATVHPSRVFEVFRDRGTLNVGAPADVAVLELRQGSFEFVDNYQNKRTGRQRLFPSGTVLGGKRV